MLRYDIASNSKESKRKTIRLPDKKGNIWVPSNIKRCPAFSLVDAQYNKQLISFNHVYTVCSYINVIMVLLYAGLGF